MRFIHCLTNLSISFRRRKIYVWHENNWELVSQERSLVAKVSASHSSLKRSKRGWMIIQLWSHTKCPSALPCFLWTCYKCLQQWGCVWSQQDFSKYSIPQIFYFPPALWCMYCTDTAKIIWNVLHLGKNEKLLSCVIGQLYRVFTLVTQWLPLPRRLCFNLCSFVGRLVWAFAGVCLK